MGALATYVRGNAVGAAFALAAAGALAISASPSQAADFSKDQCDTIVGVSLDVVKHVGPAKLSSEFRGSLKAFLKSDGKTVDCAGPKNILTPTAEDAVTFNTIQTILVSGTRPVNLRAAGVRSVDPAELAANPPATASSKRTELQIPVVR